jgi:hypothetical protein
VVIPAGTTANLRVTTQGTPAASAAGKPTNAKVTWRTLNRQVASVKENAKKGTATWRIGGTSTLKLKAFRPGSTALSLTSPGAKTAIIGVKVVPRKTGPRLRRVTLTAPRSTLEPGQSLTLKPHLTPAGAIRSSGTWSSTNRQVATVDPVGRVTAKAKGTTVIVLKVGGKTARLTIQVR